MIAMATGYFGLEAARRRNKIVTVTVFISCLYTARKSSICKTRLLEEHERCASAAHGLDYPRSGLL
jgi:hypothetical protein